MVVLIVHMYIIVKYENSVGKKDDWSKRDIRYNLHF